MTASALWAYLGLWSLVGALLFSAFVVWVMRSGAVYSARERDGSLKPRMPWRGCALMGGFLIVIVAFQVAANYIGLVQRGVRLAFWPLLALNLGHFFILLLYDTLVIDGLVIGLWRPAFLRLPEEMGWDSMKVHMLRTIPVGTAFMLLLSGASTLISYFVWMR